MRPRIQRESQPVQSRRGAGPADIQPPATLKECRDRLDAIQSEITFIEAQLSDRNRRGRDGERMNARQYQGWRRSALYTLSMKLKEKRYLTRWRAQQLSRIDAKAAGVDPTDCEALLRASSAAQQRLVHQVGAANIDDEILRVFDLVRDTVLGMS